MTDEQFEINFCSIVEDMVLIMYGLEDTADLCFTLLETGVIAEDATAEQAARIVAQHLQQA